MPSPPEHEDLESGSIRTSATHPSTIDKLEDFVSALEQFVSEPQTALEGETKAKKSGAQDREDPALQAGWSEIASRVKAYNTQKIRDCNEDIDTLLVFAGLFSAVLTAFNIESYRQLLPDPNATTVLLLSQIARQLNSSLAGDDLVQAFQASSDPDTTSVRINSLWFASLLLSLITAALAILVKQWLRQFVVSDLQDAKAYCYRHWGLDRYQVYGIADTLPMMLQASLALFLVGFVYFAWSLNRTVAIITTTLVALWFATYFSTIVACIPDPVCPYRTPFVTNMTRLIKSVVFYVILLFTVSCVAVLFGVINGCMALFTLGKRIPLDMQLIFTRWRVAADNLGLLWLRTPFKVTVPNDSQLNMSILFSAYAAVQDDSLLDPIKRCLQLDPPSHEHVVQTTAFTQKLHFNLAVPDRALDPITQYAYDEFQEALKRDGTPNNRDRKWILNTLEDTFSPERVYGDLLNVAFSQDDDFLDYDAVKVFLWDCFFSVKQLDQTCVIPTTKKGMYSYLFV
ncbi:hypothetical protein K474DRAFT_691866 [Panus rudis PR-1116 ss-1]|nr:hypothetical protein K474DRAFT_691866 [Panus rudis PR-1116 ss-1]